MLLIFKNPHISGSKEIGFVCFSMKAILFLLKLLPGSVRVFFGFVFFSSFPFHSAEQNTACC